MKVSTSDRLAHHSSFALSCILNALLFWGIMHWVKPEHGPVPPGQIIKSIEPFPQEPPVEIPPEIKPVDPGSSGPDIPLPPRKMTKLDPPQWETQIKVDFENQVRPEKLGRLFGNEAGPVQLPYFLGYRGPEKREQAIREYLPLSVADLSEPAVLKALDWLQAHQHENGSWTQNGDLRGGGSNAGYTGLALLTFLAHGETPASEKYGPTVAKAIRFLVEHQDAAGVLQPAGKHTVYGHAIATYALAEAYLMTDNVLLQDPLARAVRVIIDGQMPNGGFNYEYRLENRMDLSVGAWHVQALTAVAHTDVLQEEVAARLQLAMDGMLLGSKKIKDGSRGYTYMVMGEGVDAPRRIISAAGSLACFLSGRGKGREARESMKYMKQFCQTDLLPRWGSSESGAEHGGEIMFWYYAVQAYFQDDSQGRDFKQFVQAMITELVAHQESDGRWTGFTDQGIRQGPVFNTTLGALSLMVPYRYNLGMHDLVEPDVKPLDQNMEEEVVFGI